MILVFVGMCFISKSRPCIRLFPHRNLFTQETWRHGKLADKMIVLAGITVETHGRHVREPGFRGKRNDSLSESSFL